MDKLSIKDTEKHISENRENTAKIDLDDKYPSYVYKIKGRYWIVSLIAKLDDLLQDNVYLENLTEVFKFSFNTSVVFDSFVAVDDKESCVVQRMVKEDEKNNIVELIDEHEAYVQQIIDILYINKPDSNKVVFNNSQVLMP